MPLRQTLGAGWAILRENGRILELDRTARASVAAPPDRCMAVLGAVTEYPSWSSLIRSVSAVDGGGLLVRAEVLGLGVEFTCSLELAPRAALLRRVAHGDDDPERFEMAWTVSAADGGGSDVELHVTAALDVPGPARLLRGRVERTLVDGVLSDFVRTLDG